MKIIVFYLFCKHSALQYIWMFPDMGLQRLSYQPERRIGSYSSTLKIVWNNKQKGLDLGYQYFSYLACIALKVLADWQSTCHSVFPWSLQIVMEKRP